MSDYPAAVVEWFVCTGSSSYQIHPDNWNVRRTRNEPISWQLDFTEPGGDYTSSGPLGALFFCDPYDSEWNLRRWLRCNITVGEYSWASPPLVHLRFKVQVKPEGIICSITGSDQTEALLAQDEFMTEIRSTPGSGKSAQAAVAEILEKYKISLHDLTFEDYLIQIFYRVGTPLDWVRQIIEVRQGWFGWIGDTLTIYPGGIDVVGTGAAFSLTGADHVKLINYDRNAAGVYNEVVVQRVGESLAAMDRPAEGKALGFVTVTMDRACNFATLKVDMGIGYFGIADEATWFDVDGNPIGGPGFQYIGPTPAKSVRFVLSPNVGAGPFPENIPYRAMVYGTAHNDDFGGFESSYSATYADTADQGLRGKRKYKRPLVVSLVPNSGIASDYAMAWVRESLRRYTKAEVETVLDPRHYPGMICAATIEQIGLSGYNMQVESVDWSGDANSMTEKLELSRGAA